jgi:hypothetical protein
MINGGVSNTGVGGHEDPRSMRLLSVSVRKEGKGFSEAVG